MLLNLTHADQDFESKENKTFNVAWGDWLLHVSWVTACFSNQLLTAHAYFQEGQPCMFTRPCLCVDSEVLDLNRLTSCTCWPRRFAAIICKCCLKPQIPLLWRGVNSACSVQKRSLISRSCEAFDLPVQTNLCWWHFDKLSWVRS